MYLEARLAKVLDPEDKSLSHDSLKNMGVKELLILLRKYNADRNHGELNCQFKEWIIKKEAVYTAKIADIYKVGKHKVQLTYFGMIYTILMWSGCYLFGKKSTPIGITRSRYCDELQLANRLKSNNVRKALADPFYAHDYFVEANVNIDPVLVALEPVFRSLTKEVEDAFIN